jgi:predicted ATPase/DNA-binding winged helix-turn-helix (wHTH) protein
MATDTNHFNGHESSVSFGPFRLLPTQRLLTKGNKPVQVGSRAFDILIVLLERAGELVTKEELMARVWPNTFVGSANLAVHIGSLRRVLGDGRCGHRYVVNIPGRGYRFVAPVIVGTPSCETGAVAPKRAHNLPAHLTHPIGRAELINQLAAQTTQERFLTIVGPGGVGKTTVARTIAERLIGTYEHGVWLVDMASITDASLLPSALAATLGVEIGSDRPLDMVTTALADKRVLMVFDNCEHIISAAAAFATRILRAAPNVHILATSREPLRGEGERVYRLPPLQAPAATAVFDVGKAMSFPAIQLFAERATSALGEFELTDRNVPVVADICGRLDGLPLAIELAATRLDTLGLNGLSKCLNKSLDLLTQGRRTDLPRHQSLRAMLDWSHELLTDSEQTVFRRLAALPDKFALGDAVRVAGNGTQSVTTMIEILAALVAKSLVVADHGANAEPEYYLLGTTRTYSLAKLIESGEIETVRRRHAQGDQEIAEGQMAETAERELMTYSGLACRFEEIGCALRPKDDCATSVAVIASSVSTHDWQKQTRPRAVLKYARAAP